MKRIFVAQRRCCASSYCAAKEMHERQEHRWAPGLPPDSSADVVEASPEPVNVLESLHPEVREAVSLLLPDISGAEDAGARRSRSKASAGTPDRHGPSRVRRPAPEPDEVVQPVRIPRRVVVARSGDDGDNLV
jgi:hypothetical protein